MATYAEIFNQRANDILRNKVAVACLVKAAALVDATTPTAVQIAWAKAAIADPIPVADGLLKYLFGKFNATSIDTILASSDATVQTAVNAAVDKILSVG